MAKSKLCRFAPRDYIALSSAVSLAIADELDAEELTVLVAFFAVVAEQLNLIATAKGLCTPDKSDSPVTDVNEPTDPLSPEAEAEIAADKSKDIYRKKTKKKRPKAPTQ